MPTIHEIITTKIKSHAQNINSSRDGIGPTSHKGIAAVLAVSPVSSVMAPTGAENHVIVGQLLESKSSQQFDLNAPKSIPADINWNPDSDISNETGGYSIGFSLTVFQRIASTTHEKAKLYTNTSEALDNSVEEARRLPSIKLRDNGEGSSESDGETGKARFRLLTDLLS
nr:exocyst complex component SEC8 [Ipomoea batatas]